MLLTVFSSRRQSAGPSVFVLPAHLQHQVNGVGAALNDCDSQFTVNLDTFYFSIKLHYFCRQQDSHSLSSIWSRGKHRVFYFTLPSSESLLLHRFFFFFKGASLKSFTYYSKTGCDCFTPRPKTLTY